ncbi:unnamed protein product [Phytophthora lilii]|uniref:Unnamed protein product n=1 Tax=Phytophthora lilii TaxID=2077276 RepID=A0A9W6TDI3_9STRA|nr:unnamed protein product [Phytophthora lilii]
MRKAEPPFRVLSVAIETRQEHHALEIVQHEKIRASLINPEVTRYKGCGAPELKFTVLTCTEAAVGLGMIRLVQAMNHLNWRKVSRAVWYMINSLVRHGSDVAASVPKEFLTIGKQFTDDWRWSLVRELYTARYDGNHHALSRFPGDVFHRIVAFAVPPAFQHPSEFVLRWCKCSNATLFGECYWHDSYKATRSDYYRPYNNCGTSV